MLFAVRTQGMEGARLPQAAVDGLDDTSFAALVGSLTDVEPPPAVHRRLHRDTGGNPLAIIELAATLSDRQLTGAEPLPEPLPAGSALERSFGERLDALPDAVRRALVIAAADEQRETGLLTRALQAARPRIARPRARGGGGPRHDRRRPARLPAPAPAVRGLLRRATAARRDAHAALAVALDGDPRERARCAFHRAAASAGPDEDAARELERSRRTRSAARAGGRRPRVRRRARLSADDAARMPRLIEAARAFYVGGALTQSLETLDAALPLTTDPCVRADLQRLRAQCLALRIPPGETLALLVDEAERVQPFDAARAAILQLDACHAAIMTGEPREALRLAQLAWPVARAAGGTLHLAGALVLGSALVLRGESEAGDALQREARRLLETDEQSLTGWFAAPTAQFEVWLERYEDARRLLLASTARIRAKGALTALPHALLVLAHAEFHLGDWTTARAHADEALELSTELDQQIMRIQLLIVLGVLDGAEGRFDRARSRLEEADRLGAGAPVGSDAHDGRLGRAASSS